MRSRKRVSDWGMEALEQRACPASLPIANVAVAEGTIPEGTGVSPVARFVVSLSAPSATTVALNWKTMDGTATVADRDYVAAAGTLVFAPGQTSKAIGVVLRGDAVPETDESFGVILSRPLGATLGRSIATATIRNDDVGQPSIPSLAIGNATLVERSVGRTQANITVTLSEPTNRPVSVRFGTVDGTATAADRDYVATSQRLVFAPGETTKTVAVGVLGDTKTELDEVFGVELSAPTGATIAAPMGTVTIVNDDLAPPPPVVASVVAGDFTGGADVVVEGDGGSGAAASASFTIRLSRPAEVPVRVAYTTVDGTATVVDRDYTPTSGSVTFAIGETTKVVRVPIVGDAKPEMDESFSMLLVSAVGSLLDRKPAIATIIDDDPELRVAGVGVTEGNSGNASAVFVVSLNRPALQPVTVTYATQDGTATVSDSDYIAASGSLTFTPGETVKTVSVSVVGDTAPERDETFTLRLVAADYAAIGAGTGTATIINDDSSGASGFQITVAYSGTVRQSIKDACDWAAMRWSQVIIGDLPDVVDPETGATVDDLRITVQEGLLGGGDAPGGALANAGPRQFRSGVNGLPWDAEAGIDPNDASDSQLRNIVLHEFGHALGFGIRGAGKTFYSRYIVGDGFTGPNALQAYRSIFGTSVTSVPLETGGGSGTAGAHWRESVFRTELMTGFSEAPGVPMPLSAITVGAMQDLGYQVSVAAADPYSAPIRSSGALQAAVSHLAAAAVRPTQMVTRMSRTGIAALAGHAVHAAVPASGLPGAAVAESEWTTKPRVSKERTSAAFVGRAITAAGQPLPAMTWRVLGRLQP